MSVKREITPELLARVTAVVFAQVQYQDVLKNVGTIPIPAPKDVVLFDSISHEQIANWMMEDAYFSQSYSKDDCLNYAWGVTEYVWTVVKRKNSVRSSEHQRVHVFDLLLVTLEDLLLMNHKQIECSYEHLMSWRLLCKVIGEEVPVSAKYAVRDYEQGLSRDHRKYYDWPLVVPHSNKAIDRLLEKGISDHHYHLWGSTPYFQVSWINLMNHPANVDFQQKLRRMIKDFYGSEPGDILLVRTAWIRWYLWSRLSGYYRLDAQEIAQERMAVCDCTDSHALILMRRDLQSRINALGYENHILDYALNCFPSDTKPESEAYQILYGERALYHRVFFEYCKPESSRCLSRDDFALFFAYTLMRNLLRNKMVQVNDKMGFSNFQEYERRKFEFLGTNKKLRDYLVQLAVTHVVQKPRMKELEIRISPSVEEMRRLEKSINSPPGKFYIDRAGRIILAEYDKYQKFYYPLSCYCPISQQCTGNYHQQTLVDKAGIPLEDKYYYVFHFLRRQDTIIKDTSSITAYQDYRWGRYRRELLRQTLRIIHFRKRNPLLAQKLRGVDVASKEIGCRPEVFARVYRLLGEYAVGYTNHQSDERVLPELGKTFHVGEDFLDVVDGLRAVDEAVKFLKLDRGDRLGHATVLGIDVETWYERKHWQVSMPAQDYLDNLVWVYHAMDAMNIQIDLQTRGWILKEFEHWFRIIYRNSISESRIQRIMELAEKYYREHEQEDNGRYQQHACNFSIWDYYRAWSLRGDDPECYRSGWYKKPADYASMFPRSAYMDHDTFPENYGERYVPEYSLLNYLYQYDYHVRLEGQRRIRVEIPTYYAKVVKLIQTALRNQICNRCISIETNPTSNLLISPIRAYAEHPLLVFNNKGLRVTGTEDNENGQLHVSINTDNNGVFYTSLEMEYALMLRSVEAIKDKDGTYRFTPDEIYTWANHIREMGSEQSFRFPEK